MTNESAHAGKVGGEPVAQGRVAAGVARRPLRVVVGIDPYEPFEPILKFLHRLAPTDLEVHLVHAFDPEPAHDAHDRGQHAELTLAGARNALEVSGLGAAWIQRTHDVVGALMDVAASERADLIVIGAPRRGGKVAKGLLKRAKTGILVVRSAPAHDDGIHAVVATDHSEFMRECLYKLLDMNPAGISEVTILTANEIVDSAAAMVIHGLPALADKAESWISEKLLEENESVCSQLSGLGTKCTPLVRDGHPIEAIGRAMAELNADLLIVGAPFHCPLERFVLGSVSADEILNSPYSVMALRAVRGTKSA